MKKLIPLFFLFILIAACAAPQPQVTVTSEVTVTLTLPPIPTPSPTETAAQKRERVASELIRAGASANDPESWQKTAEGAAHYAMFENASNPDIATDKKLTELDVFMTDLRRADMEQWIAQDTEAARAVLAAFARSGLMMNGSPQEADILAATAEGLTEFNASLNSKDRLLLEVVRRAMAKEETVLSPVEIIAMETDPDGNVPYAVNVTRGKLKEGAPGNYGMWIKDSESYMQPGAWSAMDIPYTIPMFGRTTFNGKELVRKGALLGDVIWADFVGVARLPEGKTGAVVLLKNFDGTPYIHTYELVLDTDEPVVIPQGSMVLGTRGSASEKNPYPTIRDVALTTMYAINKANYKEDKQQLTMDVLKQWLEWTPYRVWIQSGFAPMMPAGNPTQFFDPVNGLMVIGSEIGWSDHRMGYLFFGTNFGLDGKNAWP